MESNNKEKIGIMCAIICQIFYGFSFLFTKNMTETVTTMELISWRFILASLFFNILIVFKVLKVDFKGKNIASLVKMAIFHPVAYFTFETLGIKMTTASESGIIIATIPVITLIFAIVVLKEKPGRKQVSGILLTLVGVIIVVTVKGGTASFNLLGYIILFAAVTVYSIYSIRAQREKTFTDTEKTYIMIMMGAISFTLIAFIQSLISGDVLRWATLPFCDTDFLFAIVYLGVGSSVIAFLCSNVAITTIGSSRMTSFASITTVITVIAGMIILGESVTALQIMGMILILVGVYIANGKQSG